MSVTLDELQAFLSQQPPRTVPAAIRKRALARTPLALVIFGLIFGGFGVPFLIGFFPWRLMGDISLNAAGRSTTDAEVVALRETAMSENDREVVRYEFAFTPDAGGRWTGTCYSSTTRFSVGSQVAAEYLPGDPGIARIQGCRLSKFHWAAGFVVIFPLGGFAMVHFVLRARRRLHALLRDGHFSTGRIESVEATNVTVNDRRRYRVNVSFTAGFDAVTTSYSAYGTDVTLAEQKRDSGATVGVLFDPADPSRVLLVDGLLG